MKRAVAVIAAIPLAAALVPAALAHEEVPETPVQGQASHDSEDIHSDNMTLVANWNDDGGYRAGTDLAFWGDLAVLGQFSDPGGFYLMDIADPEAPQPLSHFECPGPQSDVSIWGDLVFVSVDNARESTECGAGDAGRDQILAGEDWSGIRIVDISDPTDPQQIHAVRTDCGSHTHTLVPDGDRVLVYVSSYPLRDQGPNCSPDHRKISVVEVDPDRPEVAEVIAEPDVSPAVGCHDITVFLELELAAAGCLTESQLWDISDPAAPEIVAHIRNPSMNIHHSATFSWDGEVLVLGDEMGGAAGAAGCFDGGHTPTGALWFYDITDPASPEFQSFYAVPEQHASVLCTAHLFNAVPLRSDKRILVTSWYNGGTHVIDFTDPENVERIGHYIPQDGGRASAWASYWHNGYVYANNFDEGYVPPIPESRGFDVFRIDHPDLEDHILLDRLNPATQEPLPADTEEAAAPEDDEEVLAGPPAEDPGSLPATGAPAALVLAGVLSLAAAVVVRRLGPGK